MVAQKTRAERGGGGRLSAEDEESEEGEKSDGGRIADEVEFDLEASPPPPPPTP